MLKLRSAAFLLFALTAAGDAYSHARFRVHQFDETGKVLFNSNTPPRNDSTGLKTGPCGDVPRTTTPKVYKPGQELEIQWEETINHPGYYTVSFSKEGDVDFESTVLIPKYEDTFNDAIVDGKNHLYSAKVKLPNVTCDACTLQLIQVMTEDPLNPRLYYSCSDIKLTNETQSADVNIPKAPDPTLVKPAKPTNVKVKKN